MLLISNNKNPINKIDWKQLIWTKIPKSLGLKFSIKMLENCDFNEKERVFKSYLQLRTKTIEKFVEENDKNGLDWINQRRKVRKLLKKFEKCEEHVRKASFKTLLAEFWLVKNKPQSIEKQIRSIQL